MFFIIKSHELKKCKTVKANWKIVMGKDSPFLHNFATKMPNTSWFSKYKNKHTFLYKTSAPYSQLLNLQKLAVALLHECVPRWSHYKKKIENRNVFLWNIFVFTRKMYVKIFGRLGSPAEENKPTHSSKRKATGYVCTF